jgi:hypothetical protein
MTEAGEELDSYRRSLMLERELGLTKLYNQVHDPKVADSAVERLRQIHVEIDEAVSQAYGWTDLVLGHGFHETRQGIRFTIAPEVQVEVLDRLLELNHARYAEEVARGLHSGKSKGKSKGIVVREVSGEAAGFEDGGLFPPPDSLF